MKNSQTLLGILGGLAVGAILGVLFAPDAGSNTRKKIIKKSADATNDFKEHLNNIVNSASGKFNSLVNTGEELAEKGTDGLHNIKKMNKQLGA